MPSTTRSSSRPWRYAVLSAMWLRCAALHCPVARRGRPSDEGSLQGYLSKVAAAHAKGRRVTAAAAAAGTGEENASGPDTPRADKLLRLPLKSLTAADMNTRSPSKKRALPR